MFDLHIILLATGGLQLIVGHSLGESGSAKRAALIGAIVVAVYAYVSVHSQSATGGSGLVAAIWGSTMCLVAFMGLAVGYALGARSRRVGDTGAFPGASVA